MLIEVSFLADNPLRTQCFIWSHPHACARLHRAPLQTESFLICRHASESAPACTTEPGCPSAQMSDVPLSPPAPPGPRSTETPAAPKAPGPGHPAPARLGCSKCRYAPLGCGVCRRRVSAGEGEGLGLRAGAHARVQQGSGGAQGPARSPTPAARVAVEASEDGMQGSDLTPTPALSSPPPSSSLDAPSGRVCFRI